mmetsp:Transcript_51340/g.162305  ORF Transcript_51340/g.162305 Transcript_51340/m.162305 type:complete len:241 (+) Transcript_51340:180-902(+)
MILKHVGELAGPLLHVLEAKVGLLHSLLQRGAPQLGRRRRVLLDARARVQENAEVDHRLGVAGVDGVAVVAGGAFAVFGNGLQLGLRRAGRAPRRVQRVECDAGVEHRPLAPGRRASLGPLEGGARGAVDALAVAEAERQVEHRLGVPRLGRALVAPRCRRRVDLDMRLAERILTEQPVVREAEEEVGAGGSGARRAGEPVDRVTHPPRVHLRQRLLKGLLGVRLGPLVGGGRRRRRRRR